MVDAAAFLAAWSLVDCPSTLFRAYDSTRPPAVHGGSVFVQERQAIRPYVCHGLGTIVDTIEEFCPTQRLRLLDLRVEPNQLRRGLLASDTLVDWLVDNVEGPVDFPTDRDEIWTVVGFLKDIPVDGWIQVVPIAGFRPVVEVGLAKGWQKCSRLIRREQLDLPSQTTDADYDADNSDSREGLAVND